MNNDQVFTSIAVDRPSISSKSLGLHSLKHVSDLSGVSEQTLINWHKNKPVLFRTVLIGLAKSESMYQDMYSDFVA